MFECGVKRFLIHSFGCQMNALDTERIADLLCDAGWQLAASEADADLVIFNTCCVRRSAEQRAVGRIARMKPWRTQRRDRLLAVCGCIAQKESESLLLRFPFVDLVVGTRDYASLPALIESVIQNNKRVAATGNIASVRLEVTAPRRTKSVRAFVTIMYGCNNFCTYCIVPYVRGREVCRPKNEIIAEIKSLASRGVKDVILLGQNVNSYKDTSTGADFPDLLYMVNGIAGIKRIRYTTSHPKDASDKLIRAVSELGKVCENFHLPVQAGSDVVLKRMRRGYTRADYVRLIERIRSRIADATITTDLMVGFPGESDADFRDTLNLCKEVEWDAAFTFVYSPRPGTEAARWQDDVPPEVKKARIMELVHLQEAISTQKNAALKGRTIEVLVGGKSRRSPKDLAGHDRGDRTVIFPAMPGLIGKIVSVRIVRTTSHTLIAELIGERETSPDLRTPVSVGH